MQLNGYCELAAVTAGADGLYLAYEDRLFHASHIIDETDIFSIIGSGNCLLAGLALTCLTKMIRRIGSGLQQPVEALTAYIRSWECLKPKM